MTGRRAAVVFGTVAGCAHTSRPASERAGSFLPESVPPTQASWRGRQAPAVAGPRGSFRQAVMIAPRPRKGASRPLPIITRMSLEPFTPVLTPARAGERLFPRAVLRGRSYRPSPEVGRSPLTGSDLFRAGGAANRPGSFCPLLRSFGNSRSGHLVVGAAFAFPQRQAHVPFMPSRKSGHRCAGQDGPHEDRSAGPSARGPSLRRPDRRPLRPWGGGRLPVVLLSCALSAAVGGASQAVSA